MEIYCENCRKTVGKIAEEKIPADRPVSVTCPLCGGKIPVKKTSAAEPSLHESEAALAASTEAPEPGCSESKDSDPPPPDPTTATPANHTPNFDFSIMAVLREAWQKTTGFKGPIWISMLLVMAAMLGIGFVTLIIQKIMGTSPASIALGVAVRLTADIAIAPVTAGYLMIALKHVQGEPVNYRMTFAYFSSFLPLIVASLLMTIMVTVGFCLLIIPGIYLAFSYLLVLPLIVDKKMGPWQAMETSRKTIHRCWFKVFLLQMGMGLVLVASALPFGIGLIWTLPMGILVTGILYREIFGPANGQVPETP